jgi:pimeloyl-ACP methyl ester carboxylesterase
VSPGRIARVLLATAAAAGGFILVSSERKDRPQEPPHEAVWVPSGELRLRAVRAGSGRTLVLLHGYGESLLAWRAVFDSLSHHGDVVAFDLPGHGLSSKPPTGYSNEALATAILTAMSNLGITDALVVGHSLGGGVAGAMAHLAPERVRGLVLIAPAAWVTPRFLPAADNNQPAGQGVRAIITEYEALRPRFRSPLDPAWVRAPDAASATYSGADDQAYRVALQAVLREFDFAYLGRGRAASIAAPALIIWGELDPLTTLDQGNQLAAALPLARLVVLERSWHRPHVERPDEVSGLIVRFLNTH